MTFNEFKLICCDFISKNGNKKCGEFYKDFTTPLKNKKLFDCDIKFKDAGFGRFHCCLDEHNFLVRDNFGWYFWQPFVTRTITDEDYNNFIFEDIV